MANRWDYGTTPCLIPPALCSIYFCREKEGERRSSNTPPWEVEGARSRLAWREDESSNG